MPMESGSPTSPIRWSSSDTGPPDPSVTVVVVSERPTVINACLFREHLLCSAHKQEALVTEPSAIAGYDEVARSSALEREPSPHATRPIPIQC